MKTKIEILFEVIESQNDALKMLNHAIELNGYNYDAQLLADGANTIIENCKKLLADEYFKADPLNPISPIAPTMMRIGEKSKEAFPNDESKQTGFFVGARWMEMFLTAKQSQ